MKKSTLFIIALFISIASFAQIGAITGTFNVCVGSTTTLNCTPGGGSWASSNPSFAAINPSSGVVTGVAAGVVTITYFAIGTYSVASFTVNPTPTILCPSSGCKVCVGSSINLTGSPTGGVWTSGNLSLATVGSSSGTVTGVNPGTVNITYTLSTGCNTTASVLVNPSPGPITGTLVVCAGSSTTLNCTPSGGTWTNSPITPGTITSGTGVFTGIAAGVSTVSYTNSFGCSATADVTVNTSPTISGLSSGITLQLCVGTTLTLNATPAGGSWSSLNIPVATIGSGTGVVTGITPGVANMVYTLPGGCSANVSVTVNPNPGAITGTMTVCVGAGTTLTCPPGTGVWSSSPLTIASVGSGTGVVIGVSPGVATVTYTLATGCIATTTVTVNPQPVILGYTAFVQVCQGSSVNMTGSPTGGVWASGNTSIATIGSSSGLLTGVTPGLTFISYTLLPGGCSVTLVVTVSPAAGPITGNTSICTGTTTTLNCTPSGGSWSSSPLTVGTITPVTGVFTGISAGIATVTYTMPTGCFATTTVTVNLTPRILGTSTGLAPEICVGSSVTLGATPAGGVWSSLNIPIATVGSSSGTVTGISPGVATIVYTLFPGGCTATIAVTVDPNPGPITGIMSVCAGATTTLNCTPSGGSWSSSPLTVGTITSGTGVFTGISAGVATVTYTLSTGCFITATVTVNPQPSIGLSTGLIPQICVGSSITLGATPAGGVWSSLNIPIATVGSSSGIVIGISPGVATILYTLYPGGCFASITVTVTPNPGPITGTINVCVGSSTILSCLPGGGFWSSSPLTVGTITGTGVFTGISAGIATVTYALSTGCFITANVTVNPLPTILGISSGAIVRLCVGATLSLTGSPAGGIWTSSNTGVATVGSSSGIITGVAPGTVTIVYTLPTGCSVSITVIVSPNPGPITGTMVVCVGGSTTLSATPTGGSWSCSPLTVGTISGTGVFTGISGGIATVTYTSPAGCFVTALVTVNPLPVLTGPFITCVGSSVTLTGSPALGTWVSSTPAVATIGVSSGIVTGITPGTTVVTYTISTGCSATVVVTITPTPGPIACPSTGCQVCQGSTMLLTDPVPGGTWSSSNPAIATVGSASGVVTGVSAGTSYITYTLGGCYVVSLITVNPLPAAFTMTGGGSYCAGGPGVAVGLSGSQLGVNYQLFCGLSPVGPAIAGTGLPISFGLQTGPCVYTAIAVNAFGCSTAMTGSAAVTVNPMPLPIVCPLSGCAGCVGISVLLTDPTPGGIWSSSNPGIATVVATSGVVAGVSPGVTVITYTLPGGCFVTTNFTVNPSPAAITGPNHVCVGTTIVLSSATPGGTWSSSCGNVSVNSASGVVTGIAAGPCNSITYTLPGGCYVTYAVTVNPLPCNNVGVDDVSLLNGDVRLFPNPATNQITIQMDEAAYRSCTITNIVGKVVVEKDILAKEITIDIKALSPAIYFVTLRGDKGILVKRFVKD